jgi:hypothetical protein
LKMSCSGVLRLKRLRFGSNIPLTLPFRNMCPESNKNEPKKAAEAAANE